MSLRMCLIGAAIMTLCPSVSFATSDVELTHTDWSDYDSVVNMGSHNCVGLVVAGHYILTTRHCIKVKDNGLTTARSESYRNYLEFGKERLAPLLYARNNKAVENKTPEDNLKNPALPPISIDNIEHSLWRLKSDAKVTKIYPIRRTPIQSDEQFTGYTFRYKSNQGNQPLQLYYLDMWLTKDIDSTGWYQEDQIFFSGETMEVQPKEGSISNPYTNGDSGSPLMDIDGNVAGIFYGFNAGNTSVVSADTYRDFYLDTINGWYAPTLAFTTGGVVKEVKIQSLLKDRAASAPNVDLTGNYGELIKFDKPGFSVEPNSFKCHANESPENRVNDPMDGSNVKPYDVCTFAVNGIDGVVAKMTINNPNGGEPAIMMINEQPPKDEIIPDPQPQPDSGKSGGSGGSMGFLTLLGLVGLGLRRRIR
ncbi:trypsin-like serine protease [Photobacterium damselae]|nr:trypsin-like serine protease [Photobacterium damselae]